MSWTFAEERPIYWEEPPEQIAITNVETGEWDFYMLTSAATKRIRKLKDEVNWLHVELKEAESTCDDCHAISELRDLRDEVNWLNAELHGAELKAERACHIKEDSDTGFPICSECGAVQSDEFIAHYCWNCGAKVVEG